VGELYWSRPCSTCGTLYLPWDDSCWRLLFVNANPSLPRSALLISVRERWLWSRTRYGEFLPA
jgi:hypothetical protein